MEPKSCLNYHDTRSCCRDFVGVPAPFVGCCFAGQANFQQAQAGNSILSERRSSMLKWQMLCSTPLPAWQVFSMLQCPRALFLHMARMHDVPQEVSRLAMFLVFCRSDFMSRSDQKTRHQIFRSSRLSENEFSRGCSQKKPLGSCCHDHPPWRKLGPGGGVKKNGSTFRRTVEKSQRR